MSILEIKDLTYSYGSGEPALRGVSLTVNEGDRIAIIGENGSGKTTLSKMINHLLVPDEGTVRIRGEDTRNRTTAQVSWHAAYVFQNPDDQIFKSSVRDEVEASLRARRLPEDEIRTRTDSALARVRLSAYADTHPYDLSLTKRKFVAIATVLAMDADIYIFDEPTAGLDPGEKTTLIRLLDELESESRTTITVTHDMDFVAECYEKVIVMSGGQIVRTGTPKEIFPDHEFLETAGVDAPYITKLMRQFPGGENIVLMSEAVDYWREYL